MACLTDSSSGSVALTVGRALSGGAEVYYIHVIRPSLMRRVEREKEMRMIDRWE